MAKIEIDFINKQFKTQDDNDFKCKFLPVDLSFLATD